MRTTTIILAVLTAAAILSAPAEAAHRRHIHHHYSHHSAKYYRAAAPRQEAMGCVSDNSGRTICLGAGNRTSEARIETRRAVYDGNNNSARVVGGVSPECRPWYGVTCGCEVSTSAAEARQRHHHYKAQPVHADALPKTVQYQALDCDNNGRCRVQQVTKDEARILTTRHRAKRSVEVAAHLDANGNTTKLIKDTRELLPNGMVRVTTAYGKPITVNPVDASKFLKFFALLKEHDYKFNWALVGCYSPGGHKPGSNHHIGRACDIQTGWNQGPEFVYRMRDIVRQAGLFNGCDFGDCGHVEAVRGLYNKRPNLYASIEKFKADQSTASYQP